MNEIKLGKLSKSKIIHIIENHPICKKTKSNKDYILLNNNSNNDNDEIIKEKDKYKICKLCSKKIIFNKILIDNRIYYEYNNIIYTDNNILNYTKYGKLQDDILTIIPFNTIIQLISLNKKKYYLINDSLLYSIDNSDIFKNILDNSIGKLLGPKMAIMYTKEENKKVKNMVIIEKLKYNMWEKLS